MRIMENKKTLKLQAIKDSSERDVLVFLKSRSDCIYGEIIKELRLSTAKGQEAIYSLLNKGYIKHKGKTSKLELNVEVY